VDLVVTADGVASNAVRISPNAPGLGEWGTRAGLLEPNSEYAVAELNGRIYVMGGYPATRQTQRTVQVYNPVSDAWELATPLPLPLNHNMSATVNGKLYMIGGQLTDAGAGNFSDRVFEYDPETKEWRERARMPAARGAGVAVVADGKIYVAGSRPPRGADFAVYDPATDTWRTLPDLPTQRNHLAGAAVGGKIYIVGGRFEGGAQSPQTDRVEVYDPATNTWTARAPMPRPRGGINGLEALGCIHIFGGEGNPTGPNNLYPDHDVYNPVTDAWTSFGPMPVPVHGVTGAVFLNGLIYLPGGGTAIGGNSGSLHHQVFRPDMVCR
jgi:N-acetylneuraminic acid mutarotase